MCRKRESSSKALFTRERSAPSLRPGRSHSKGICWIKASLLLNSQLHWYISWVTKSATIPFMWPIPQQAHSSRWDPVTWPSLRTAVSWEPRHVFACITPGVSVPTTPDEEAALRLFRHLFLAFWWQWPGKRAACPRPVAAFWQWLKTLAATVSVASQKLLGFRQSKPRRAPHCASHCLYHIPPLPLCSKMFLSVPKTLVLPKLVRGRSGGGFSRGSMQGHLQASRETTSDLGHKEIFLNQG